MSMWSWEKTAPGCMVTTARAKMTDIAQSRPSSRADEACDPTGAGLAESHSRTCTPTGHANVSGKMSQSRRTPIGACDA
jgi:hypothetical protein